ncbi:MAG TPA: neutral/alkaline non-lysosomal ceramidase N-terminal domain-containing protein [Prolixibacteraceae bacterium]|nr:neutral/alkaline non-lysosomal ceramidase N-terminal domain-containing protein [Prolixibacteraceae bacterium]
MKKVLYFFLFLAGLLGILFLVSTGSVKEESFLTSDYFKQTMLRVDSIRKSETAVTDSLFAGFSRVSITPSINNASDDPETGKFISVPLAGFGARKGKPATGVHDSIFVRSVALKTGSKLIVFVGADLLIMPPNIIDAVVEKLASKGISRDQLLFSASHSHSSVGGWGPGFIGEQFAGKENPAIQQWLVKSIVKSVEIAVADLSKSQWTSGNFDAGSYTRNRLIGDLGTKNSDFNYLILEQMGKRKAVVGTFSAHSTTLGAGNLEFSGDYPGYWERKMEDDSFDVALFCAGSVGSQSPTGKGKAFESAAYIGESLADSLLKRLPDTTFRETATLSAASLRVTMPEYHIRLTTKLNMASWLSDKLMPEPKNVYFQAVRIGQLIWISAPSDFSGEYALQIKHALAAKGFDGAVSSFNGSYIGYIVPGRYFYLDEYEPKLMGMFGPTMGDYSMDLIRHITNIVGK